MTGSSRRGGTGPHTLSAKIAGPAAAAGAIAVGLVLIGVSGLGHRDVHVAPPPLNAGLQSASGGPNAGRPGVPTATYEVYIPPSPSWQVAPSMPRTHTETSPPDPADPGALPLPPQFPMPPFFDDPQP